MALSACNSGIDLIYDSEGVSGLAKAFLSAGARNVILTLWSVDDEATSTFMAFFYEEVAKGRSIKTALMEARNRMIRRTKYKHPWYWAGFVLYGVG